MTNGQLLGLARLGAARRLEELNREVKALRAFLADRRPRSTAVGRRRKRPVWTAAQRKAVSVRMKKYWAARRKKA
jgi:hypothetical protein